MSLLKVAMTLVRNSAARSVTATRLSHDAKRVVAEGNAHRIAAVVNRYRMLADLIPPNNSASLPHRGAACSSSATQGSTNPLKLTGSHKMFWIDHGSATTLFAHRLSRQVVAGVDVLLRWSGGVPFAYRNQCTHLEEAAGCAD